MGGLHLKAAGEEVVAEALACTDAFRAEGFTFCGGHCTGAKAIDGFRKAFGDDAVRPLGAGRVLSF